MARPLRIEIKDGWYHVTARRNNRQAIYLDRRDRVHLLELLGELSQRCELAGASQGSYKSDTLEIDSPGVRKE